MSRKSQSTHDSIKTLLLGVYLPGNQIHDMDAYFDEFESLVKTLGIEPDEKHFMKMRAVDASHFFTSGKMNEVAQICIEKNIDQVICSEILTPLQERNITTAIKCKLFDRTSLILEIFKTSAHTAEGKVQVEIAELEFLKTRLSGQGRDMAQQAGFVGNKGPGETEKEVLKRYYETKIKEAKKRFEQLSKTRETQRKLRVSKNIPQVCLIGYTNAGKSSILNQLTQANVLAEDKLFATLSTTTRLLFIEQNNSILISDTVGFISKLPHTLIEAFKSTLDELQYADLLLMVIDTNNPQWEDHIAVCEGILEELEVEKDVLYVFNKIDCVEDIESLRPRLDIYSPNVLISARTKEGVKELYTYLQKRYSAVKKTK
jgi:GTP-binding protein HflX